MPATAALTSYPQIQYRPLFWLVVLLHLVYHALVLKFVNFIYLDSDQAFMWAGVADYAAGVFKEPRFYGQDYNTFFEALVAVPFRWAGMQVYHALPLATHICTLVPWMVPALYLYRKRDVARATGFLAVPLCLMISYDVLTGIPRGFVGGITCMLFFALSLRNPQNLKYAALNVSLAAFGFFINPNSLLVSGPCLLYMLLCNFKHAKFYLVAAIAVPVTACCWLFFDRFYAEHPQFVIYSVNLEISWQYLTENLRHLHQRLGHVSFFSSQHAWFTAAAYVLLLVALYIYNRRAFFASLAVPVIILGVLATNKGGDGSLWPFYSFGRSFIGLPLFFALFLTLLPARNQLSMALVVAALGTGVFKLATFNRTLDTYYDEKNWLGVHLVKVEDALRSMQAYKDASAIHESEQLMVSNHFWLNTVLSYGGKAVYDDFPVAFETNNERRYWLREGLAPKVEAHFLYISSRNDFEKELPEEGFKMKRLDDYGLYLVTENTLTNAEFIRRAWQAESE